MAERKLSVVITGDSKGAVGAFKDTENAAGGMGAKMASVGAAIGKAFVAAGAGALLVGAGLFKVGSDFDKAFDTIRVGTGATGEALAGLEGDFKAVVSSVPASFGDASTAIADLNTRLGLTGKPLQNLSGQMLELSRITKTDLATNVDNITRVFGDWGIAVEDQASSMDMLFRASQSSGIGIDQLSQSVVQFGAPLRNLGFGFDESLALLAQFNKTGVNTETVFAGLKAGVGKLAKAGEDVPTTFKRVVAEITKLGPGTEATALAIQLFGQRAGPDLADAIAGGKFELGGMLDAIQNGSDTIMQAGKDTQSFGEKWTILKNRVFVAIQPVASKLFDLLGVGMDKLSALAPKVVEKLREFQPTFEHIRDAVAGFLTRLKDAAPTFDEIRSAVASLGDKFKAAAEAVRPVFEAIVGFVKDNPGPVIAAIGAVAATAFGAWAVSAGAAAVATLAAAAPFLLIAGAIALVAGGLVYAYQHFEGFRNVVDGVANWLTGTAWPMLQAFATLVADGFGALVGWVQEHWDQIKGYIDGAIRTISTVVGGVIDGIKLAWQTWGDELLTIASTYWGYIKGTVENAIKLVKGVIDVVMGIIRGDWGKAWDGIKGIVGAVWDQIKLAAETGLKLLGSVISAAWDGIKLVASTAWDGFKRIISEAIDGAIEFVKGLPGRIVDAIGNLADKLYQAGKDLIAGLVRGIRDSIPSISDVLGSVTDMIPDWKGPKQRDAKLLAPNGRLIMEGLTDGFDAALPAVRAKLERITVDLPKSVPTALASAPTMAVPAGRGGGDTYVTFQVQGHVLDGRELGRLAAEGLNEYGASQNQPIIATSLVGA